jgi:hypothetical protein
MKTEFDVPMSNFRGDDCERNFHGRMASICLGTILYHIASYPVGTSLKRLLADVWLWTLRFATMECQKAASENE